MGTNSVNYAGYTGYVNPNFKAGEVNTEMISPQTKITYTTKPDEFVKKSSPDETSAKEGISTGSKVAIGIGIACGILACLHPKTQYLSRQLCGKKGIQNFINRFSHNPQLVRNINELSTNPEIAKELEKLSAWNLEYIAKKMNTPNTLNLVLGKSQIVIENPKGTKAAVDFANKKGYQLIKEFSNAETQAKTFNELINKVKQNSRARSFIIDRYNADPQTLTANEIIATVNPRGKACSYMYSFNELPESIIADSTWDATSKLPVGNVIRHAGIMNPDGVSVKFSNFSEFLI